MAYGLVVLLAQATGAAEGPLSADPDWAFPGDGFVPVNARDVHDPSILRVGSTYFCFSTNGKGFGLLRSSRDLHHWSRPRPVMPERPGWLREALPSHGAVWAPDVVATPSGLRMYYCASLEFGKNTSWLGVAECRNFDPEHPFAGWQDAGLVLASLRGRDDFNAIDPEVVISKDGRQWLFFGSWHSGLYVTELNPETGKLKEPDTLNRILVARNRGGVEAAALYRRGEFYYLFVSLGSAAQGVRSSYHIGVGRSRALTGPYRDHRGRPLIDGGHTLVLRSSSPMLGPGHCDVFEDDRGRALLAYHYYDARQFWVGDRWGLPTLQIRELLWTDDGWPLPGMPVPRTGTPEARDPLPGPWVHQADFGRPKPVTFTEDGEVRAVDETGQWSIRDDVLTLRWPNQDRPGEYWVDQVQFAPDRNYYVGRNQAGMIIRGARIRETR